MNIYIWNGFTNLFLRKTYLSFALFLKHREWYTDVSPQNSYFLDMKLVIKLNLVMERKHDYGVTISVFRSKRIGLYFFQIFLSSTDVFVSFLRQKAFKYDLFSAIHTRRLQLVAMLCIPWFRVSSVQGFEWRYSACVRAQIVPHVCSIKLLELSFHLNSKNCLWFCDNDEDVFENSLLNRIIRHKTQNRKAESLCRCNEDLHN
jgi:hypothetical protein